MMDEHFMRTWNGTHVGFSAGITQGLKRLEEPFRRLGEWIALPSAPGEDSFFTRTTARRRAGTKRPAR